jgi:hypothetical protein
LLSVKRGEKEHVTGVKKMSILTINLKHLYQRRGLWLVYVFVVLFALAGIAMLFDDTKAGHGRFIGLIVLAFVVGLLLAVLPLEVLSKPFSYCLPGHRKMVRKFVFCVGIVFNIFGSLLFFVYPSSNTGQLLLVVCSAFSAGLIFYWLGVGLAFGVRNSAAFIGLWPFIMLVGVFFGLHVTIEVAIVGYPFGVILVGVLSSVLVWFWLGDEGWARRYCGVPRIGSLDAWNRDKMQKYCQVRLAKKWNKLKKHPGPWVEAFFLGRMNKHNYTSTGRYIWGGLYTTFGFALSQWKAAFSGAFLALVIVCFLGYMGPGKNILFIMPGLMVAQMRLPVYSSMLISGGRNERYRSAITLVIAAAVLITVMVTIIAAPSLPLATIMPDITLRGRTFIFQAMDIRLFFVPLLMIPIVFTVQLFFYRKQMFMMLLIMIVFFVLFMTSMFLHEHLSFGINSMFIIGGLVLSWGTFLLVSRYICMRRSLVGQG